MLQFVTDTTLTDKPAKAFSLALKMRINKVESFEAHIVLKSGFRFGGTVSEVKFGGKDFIKALVPHNMKYTSKGNYTNESTIMVPVDEIATIELLPHYDPEDKTSVHHMNYSDGDFILKLLQAVRKQGKPNININNRINVNVKNVGGDSGGMNRGTDGGGWPA